MEQRFRGVLIRAMGSRLCDEVGAIEGEARAAGRAVRDVEERFAEAVRDAQAAAAAAVSGADGSADAQREANERVAKLAMARVDVDAHRAGVASRLQEAVRRADALLAMRGLLDEGHAARVAAAREQAQAAELELLECLSDGTARSKTHAPDAPQRASSWSPASPGAAPASSLWQPAQPQQASAWSPPERR